jgi:hypothetical protein
LFLPLLLLFLFPIAGYCVILAMLNRRPQPTMVHGALDFLGLLFAAAGLLLFAAPAALNAFFKKTIEGTPFEEGGPSPGTVQELVWWWRVAWVGYYVLVVGGGALLVWWRSSRTVIYNVTRDDFERVLDQTLGRLRLETTRAGNRLFLGFGGAPVAEPYLEAVSTAPLKPASEPSPARAGTGDAVVDIEPFSALWNVTLNWRSSSGDVRREVEEELARGLKEVRSYDNPAGTWFLGVAGFLFALIFMVVLVLILGLLLPPRRT